MSKCKGVLDSAKISEIKVRAKEAPKTTTRKRVKKTQKG
jgi:hypothetical protein